MGGGLTLSLVDSVERRGRWSGVLGYGRGSNVADGEFAGSADTLGSKCSISGVPSAHYRDTIIFLSYSYLGGKVIYNYGSFIKWVLHTLCGF